MLVIQKIIDKGRYDEQHAKQCVTADFGYSCGDCLPPPPGLTRCNLWGVTRDLFSPEVYDTHGESHASGPRQATQVTGPTL
ncbi:hypothetical protein K443DRAFT_429871 [Laccaria amethystina LaAM-08-1]|uniref:Uncharacterized protein n=1 Tax=Laccaria amethystina LaAM-08-1 TaxID=1095629 RepID=A0A0C9WI94_9AGAR|nr:hypothetical protein K443DRAFT_429871 [Laccaria amethystina LaAM-08-1]